MTFFKNYTPTAIAGTIKKTYITSTGVGIVFNSVDGKEIKVKSYYAPRVAKLKAMGIQEGQQGVLTVATRKTDGAEFLFSFQES